MKCLRLEIVVAAVVGMILCQNTHKSFTKGLDKRVRKNPQHSVLQLTVRVLRGQSAPGAFRQGDKARETLDPCTQ